MLLTNVGEQARQHAPRTQRTARKDGCFRRLNQQVLIHCLNSLSYSSFAAIITKRLGSSSGMAAISAIDRHVMFPSIHDAVISAVRSRDFAVRNNFSGS